MTEIIENDMQNSSVEISVEYDDPSFKNMSTLGMKVNCSIKALSYVSRDPSDLTASERKIYDEGLECLNEIYIGLYGSASYYFRKNRHDLHEMNFNKVDRYEITYIIKELNNYDLW